MRFFVLPIFKWVHFKWMGIQYSNYGAWILAMPASTTQNIGCPSMTPLKMGKTKNLIFYSRLHVSRHIIMHMMQATAAT